MLTEEKTKQDKRSLILIAMFVDGYAAGWKMAVRESLSIRTALDVRMTERTYSGKTLKEWTQGNLFSFEEGFLFYDTPLAYEMTWGEALTHIRLTAQILEATPAQSGSKRGIVVFEAHRPDKSGSQLEQIGKFKTTQDEFIRFLQTGCFHPLKGGSTLSSETINLFEN